MMRKTERSRRGSTPSRPEMLESRALLTLAATAPLPTVDVAAPGTTVAPVDLTAYFKDSAPVANSFAVVNTTLGAIPVQLTPQSTPATVANFLSYANKGAYNNAIVHRSVPGFIWQTGGYSLTSAGKVAAIPQDAPVVNEPGQSNVRGTIAMAKLGGDPNSATNQFFFNESDSNASNLDNQNGGFTVFGHVVGSQGLAVMDAVAAVPSNSSPLASPLDQAPLINYTGGTVQPSNFVVITSVTPASDVYQATSDAPAVATATIQNNTLTVTPLATGTAHIDVTGFGSDGKSVTATFAVNVGGTTNPNPTTTTPPEATTTTTPPGSTTTTTTTTTTTSTGTTTTTPPTGTTTTTTTTVAPTPSVLTPTIRGKFPTAATVGRATKSPLVVTLTNNQAGKPVAQRERVSLGIYRIDGTSRPVIPVASATKAVKLRSGQHTQVQLARLKIPAGTAPGTYSFVYTVTDPSGAATTVETRQSLLVSAAGV